MHTTLERINWFFLFWSVSSDWHAYLARKFSVRCGNLSVKIISPLGMRSFQQRPRRSKNRNVEAYAAAKSCRELVRAQAKSHALENSPPCQKRAHPETPAASTMAQRVNSVADRIIVADACSAPQKILSPPQVVSAPALRRSVSVAQSSDSSLNPIRHPPFPHPKLPQPISSGFRCS
jgi:hypothetical protein